MGNKKELQELIDGLSDEEADRLRDLIEKGAGTRTSKKRRRGRGRRKKKTAKPKDVLDGIALTPEEKREIQAASDFDKAKKLNEPKSDGIISHGDGFQTVEAQCMSCNKTFSVSPALIPPEADRFQCNSCCCRR